MALVGKLEVEVEIQSSAEKFYGIFRSRAHQIPNMCPDKVSAVDVHKGDWGSTGSVKLWNYVVDEKAESTKETIESIDDEKKSVTFNLFEGDLMKYYKSFKSILQVTEKGEGALVKWTLEYEKLNEDVPPPSKYLELASSVTKDMDANLLKA